MEIASSDCILFPAPICAGAEAADVVFAIACRLYRIGTLAVEGSREFGSVGIKSALACLAIYLVAVVETEDCLDAVVGYLREIGYLLNLSNTILFGVCH